MSTGRSVSDRDADENEVLMLGANLKKYYPKTGGFLQRHVGDVKAVDGVNVRIERGETFSLVGESGCGKSTLARVFADLHEPTDGGLYFDVPGEIADEILELESGPEEDLDSDERERLDSLRDRYEIHSMGNDAYANYRQNVQFVFQNTGSSLNPRRIIADIVARPLKIHTDLNRDERRSRVVDLLERVDLGEDYLTRHPHELSGGQRQRVAIAQSIASNPEVVILDEPTSALDVSVQAQILNLLQELQDELSLSYLFITHDLGVVNYVADRVSVMYLGKIVEQGTREELFKHTKHPYTEALLSSIPEVDDADRILLEGEVPDPEDPPTGCRFHTRCHKVESFCGWSGRDLASYLRERRNDYQAVEYVVESLSETAFDGYSATFEFGSTVDAETVRAVLAGDHEDLRSEQPELFEAIEDVAVENDTARVEFLDVAEPQLERRDGQQEVACHLYD